MDFEIIEVCPYEEWICVKVNGEEMTYDLLEMQDKNYKLFYVDKNFESPRIFNLVTREIEEV